MRGLADRALVIVPAGLAQQWREELERKFALPTTMAGNAVLGAGRDHPVVIASLAAARREPLKPVLTERPWDVIIADEAHRLRNPQCLRPAGPGIKRPVSAAADGYSGGEPAPGSV